MCALKLSGFWVLMTDCSQMYWILDCPVCELHLILELDLVALIAMILSVWHEKMRLACKSISGNHVGLSDIELLYRKACEEYLFSNASSITDIWCYCWVYSLNVFNVYCVYMFVLPCGDKDTYKCASLTMFTSVIGDLWGPLVNACNLENGQ